MALFGLVTDTKCSCLSV